MSKTHNIYTLKDENGNVFYVGKTSTPTKRFKRHLAHVKYGSHYPVHNKLRKVISIKGSPDGIYEVIERGILTENAADERETFYIKFYKEAGCKLKNLTEGGEGGKGFTPEINKRGALKRVGLKRSPETRKRMSEARMGMKFTERHKNALKKAWKTRVVPSDWGKRMSELNAGKINIKRFVVVSPSGEEMITERGLTDFCRERGLDARNLINTKNGGTRKHHRGWKIISEGLA